MMRPKGSYLKALAQPYSAFSFSLSLDVKERLKTLQYRELEPLMFLKFEIQDEIRIWQK